MPGHGGELGPAQAAARCEERERFEQIGLDSPVLADQSNDLALDRQIEGLVGTEVLQDQPAYGCHDREPSHAHRHEDIERGRALAILNHCRRAGIGELEQRGVAIELSGNIHQIAGIEADIERT